MAAGVESMAEKAGINTIAPALDSGLVTLHPIEIISDFSTGNNFAHHFQDFVSDAVTSSDTYPIFDDAIAKLVQVAIREGIINPSQARIASNKHVGLSSDILQRLPLFDEATIDEVLDIRKELDRPLIRFRAAMLNFSESVKSASWDEDFSIEAEQVFRQKVEPAVLEIEEAVKDNLLLSKLGNKIAADPMLAGPVLGVIVASPTNFGHLLEQVAPAAALTIGGAKVLKHIVDAVRENKDKQREIEQNQLYFLYRAKQRLQELYADG